MMTKREIVQTVADTVVVGVVRKALKRAIDENTEIDVEDNLVVEVGTFVVAASIGNLVEPYTHKAIDSIADWRENRKAQKAVVEVVA